jgi:hypothetical protein
MNYETNADQVTLEQVGRNGNGSINFKIKGFWSGSSITMYIQRGFGGADWRVSISPSSGGRDTKEVASDTEAYVYFAEALLGATEIAKHFEASAESLEAFYQDQRAIERAEYEAKRAQEAVRIQADYELGAESAGLFVDMLLLGEASLVRVFDRGQERDKVLLCVRQIKRKLYLSGSLISRADAVKMLAAASHRSYVVPTSKEA